MGQPRTETIFTTWRRKRHVIKAHVFGQRTKADLKTSAFLTESKSPWKQARMTAAGGSWVGDRGNLVFYR